MNQAPFQKLTVVIPALNEEGAIASTISRCLAAREEIKLATDLDVEIIVVSDGSTDRTVEIASEFDAVDLIVFEQNRGYGAAIKEGFARGTGELVGFLDADGTCDPIYFVDMCRAALDDRADVVLGSRMGPDSKMPPIRRLGNRLFALLLGGLCGRQVTDTASGMRVIRRDVLDLLYPLPDRLHFTPAMSARALLNDLRVVEIPMRYEERVGTSKLQVVNDGFRFLRSILDGVLCFRPERPFFLLFTVFLLMGTFLGIAPTEHYWHQRRVEEWMIYRFVVCFLLGSAGSLLLCAAVLANRMADLGPRRRGTESFWVSLASQLFRGKILAAFVLGCVGTSSALIWPGVVEFATTGGITLHWSRIIVGAFGFLVAFQVLTTKVLMEAIDIWKYQGDRATPRPVATAAMATATAVVPPRVDRGTPILQGNGR